MDDMQWGIIGSGNIAHKFIKDLALVSTPQKIKALLGHTEDKAEEFARQYNIPQHFTELDEFINKGKPGIVYIATPHTLHYEQALACLENKIPVLCEKPLTINAEQSSHLIEVSKKNNVFLMEGMWIRFLPSLKYVIELIEKGTIGNIVSINASISFKAPHKDNRFFDPELGGGSLLDLGIYPIFLALLLLGKPSAIKALAKLTDKGVDESCNILFNYNNGASAVLGSSLLTQTDHPAEITGEKGTLKILHPWFEKAEGIELLRDNKQNILYPCFWEGHGFQFEVEEVLNCINKGKIESELLSHDLSLSVLETMDEIRRQIHVVYEMYE